MKCPMTFNAPFLNSDKSCIGDRCAWNVPRLLLDGKTINRCAVYLIGVNSAVGFRGMTLDQTEQGAAS
jgi:hypothetical protein